MHRVTIVLAASLAAGACANATPAYVVKYDLDQLAIDASTHEASPGFDSLPSPTGQASGEVPPA